MTDPTKIFLSILSSSFTYITVRLLGRSYFGMWALTAFDHVAVFSFPV